MIYRTSLIFIILGLTGCITTPTNLSDKSEPLQKAEVQPSAEALAKQGNKVILEVDTKTPHLQERNHVSTVFSESVEAILNTIGADVTNREMERALSTEKQLTEAVTTKAPSGSKPADYLIRILLTEAQYQKEAIPAHDGRDWLGRKRNFPLSFNHKAHVSANFQIYRFPDLELLKAIPVRGHSELTGAEDDRDESVAMLRKSVENSLRGVEKTHLLNLFSIKGYVVDRKLKGKDNIFRITLGSRQGAKPGAKVGFYSIIKQQPTEEISVADGVLIDQVTENSAWVLVSDATKAKLVRAGDVVKIKHEFTLLDGVINKLK